MLSQEIINFLDHWQQLLGSLLGPFLGIVLTGVGFLVKEKYQGLKSIRNSYNSIEISLALSLNETYNTIKLIKTFRQSIAGIILDKAQNTITNYCLPPVREIFVNDDLIHLKTKNYYTHNKLLWVVSGIKNANVQFSNIREDYRDSFNKIFSLIIAGKNSSPLNEMITDNLKELIRAIDGYIKFLEAGVLTIIQVRIYNNKLLGKGWYKRKKILKKFKNIPATLDGIIAIDALINSDVQRSLRDTPIP